MSTESIEDGSGKAASAPSTRAAAGSLLAGVSGDRCAVCNARLAVDQRYCVECGTRRGNPRFTLAQPEQQPGSVVSTVGQIGSAAITRVQLLLALLIILVAIGVGVLIGHGSSKAPQVTSATVTTSGSGSSGSGSGSASTTGGSSGSPFQSGG